MVPCSAALKGSRRDSTSRASRVSPCQRYCMGATGSRGERLPEAHNPKVVGSNPTPATNENAGQARCESIGPSACGAEIGAARRQFCRRRGAVQPEGRAFRSRSAACLCRRVPVAPVACRSVPQSRPCERRRRCTSRDCIGRITRRSLLRRSRREVARQMLIASIDPRRGGARSRPCRRNRSAERDTSRTRATESAT